MMTQAFYTGLSGLKSSSYSIDAISDNLANTSTVGYRGYTTEFSNLFEQELNTSAGVSSSSTVGVGVGVQSTPMMLNSGSLMLTDRSTDLAINGDGWFGVEANGNTNYTRDGSFGFDSNADLVTSDGYHVLGFMGGNISADNTLTQTITEVKLGSIGTQEQLGFPNTLTYPPQPTSIASFSGNIGTDNENFSMGAGVIDSQNNKNELKLEFSMVDPQNPPGSQWDVTATTQNLDGTTVYDTKKGRVEFDSSGALISNTLSSIDNNGTSVTIDLGTQYSGVVSLSNATKYASSNTDGIIGGDLEGYEINQNAEVIATFTNGMQSSVGKIAVFHFQNDQGLNRLNGSMFQESANSGKALFYTDANGEPINGAKVENFTLENSNYDMTVGLTDLIVYQRAYDSNSKVITTADQMLQKALDMDA